MAKKRLTKTEQLREMIQSGKLKKKAVDPMEHRIRDIADVYQDLARAYKGTEGFFTRTRVKPGSSTWRILERALKFAEELKVSPETYVKGIFYFHDKVWNSYPKMRFLADFKTRISARDKVQDYLKDLESGKTTEHAKAVSPVSHQKVVISQANKSRNSEKQLKLFMKNYKITDEEVFIRFCQGNDAHLYFDAGWLSTNKVYTQLKKEGKI